MTINNYSYLVHEELRKRNFEAVYIAKPDIFEEEYDSLLRAFQRYYSNVNIAYSFKTNYIPDFLNIVINKNGYAEVVSIMELKLALKVGFAPSNIFFNGPFKHKKETCEALSMGVLVNIDSYDEFEWIEKYAINSETKCRIGIRLNFDFLENPSRFGISTSDNAIKEIIDRSNENDNLSLESLHYHYASRGLSIWKSCAFEFISFLDKLNNLDVSNLKFVSLGGGMYSAMDDYIKKQLKMDIPSFEEYAENSVKYVVDYFRSKRDVVFNPEILIEPGTAIASKALDFAAQVVSIKNLNNKGYINTSCSKYNMNPSSKRINSPIEVYNADNSKTVDVQDAQLTGYTCIESDIVHDDFTGAVAVGDTIVFREIGAYSMVMKPPFILPDVAIIQFNKGENSFDILRHKQTFNDIFKNFTNLE